jgi:hypothetical protein
MPPTDRANSLTDADRRSFLEKQVAALGRSTARATQPPPGSVLLGRATVSRVTISLDEELRTQHVYIIGKSGKGKTTLLRNMIEQDLRLGHGLAVLAPDDELFRDYLLPSIPENRIQDVIYVDPADSERPVPLNPLHLDRNEDLHEKVDETYRAFLRLVEGQGDAGGAHRMERILRATLQTLMAIPNRTLLDIPRLLRRNPEGEKFRAWASEQLADEVLANFWTEDYPAFDKVAHQAVMNRLDRLMVPPVRRMLCTPGACLNFREAIDSNKVLLFRVTSSALKGTGNANIVGQLIVAKLKLAALSRQDVPEDKRPFFPVFIDEFQHFCAGSLEDYREMFSRTRKYRVPLTVAHLETGDLSDQLLRHILGTVSTLVFFATGASDARRLCKEMVYRRESDGKLVSLDPNEVVYLPRGRVYARVNEHVLQVETPPAPDRGTHERARQVRESSRQLYGVALGPTLGAPATAAAPRPAPAPLEDIDPGDVFGP